MFNFVTKSKRFSICFFFLQSPCEYVIAQSLPHSQVKFSIAVVNEYCGKNLARYYMIIKQAQNLQTNAFNVSELM